ncbi:cytochrome b5-like heme/steroid binding domain-containing protein [Aspergillus alliaceus]|uniref:cytochrome b5-like heme/steroid binding domain-containing protein n=1 Tax=Petromyces alliaceus TaxID=209559 RepID=UPI0012A3CE83|nr:cytochrome b5-like heme/steroid binding domain-containing protein [Aspergillus alliaceus]KAB8231248.1 cytochrome b5-like heme/steroid binding domain-containing protein [Aspergillus alliaceus]
MGKSVLPYVSPEEVLKRNGVDQPDIWLVIDDIVYDCTPFLSRHPGGDAVLKSFAGFDCSWQYHSIHGARRKVSANRSLEKLRVGWTEGVRNPYSKPEWAE